MTKIHVMHKHFLLFIFVLSSIFTYQFALAAETADAPTQFVKDTQTISQHDFSGKTNTPEEANAYAKELNILSKTIKTQHENLVRPSMIFNMGLIAKLKAMIKAMQLACDDLLNRIKGKETFNADDTAKINATVDQLTKEQNSLSNMISSQSQNPTPTPPILTNQNQPKDNNTLPIFDNGN